MGEAACRAALLDPGRLAVDFVPVTRWLAAGYDPEVDIVPTIAAVAARPGYRAPRSLAYFTEAIAETHRLRRAGVSLPVPSRDGEFAAAFAKFAGPPEAA